MFVKFESVPFDISRGRQVPVRSNIHVVRKLYLLIGNSDGLLHTVYRSAATSITIQLPTDEFYCY